MADAVQLRAAGRHCTATHHCGDLAATFPVCGCQDLAPCRAHRVSYGDHYEEKGVFERLLDRLRRIALRAQGYAPVMLPALR